MSRFRGPKGKIVRRFGVNLFGNPKYDRLLARRSRPGGGRGGGMMGRRKKSEYGLQMNEKQKLKYAYGLRERQFRSYYQKAQHQEGITGDNLMILLELRFDNVVYTMGLAPTRDAARQIVLHGHLKVNGRRVNIPSFHMREGDDINVKDAARSQNLIRQNLEESTQRPIPEWVQVNKEMLKGTVIRPPTREEIQTIADEQRIVELYSK